MSEDLFDDTEINLDEEEAQSLRFLKELAEQAPAPKSVHDKGQQCLAFLQRRIEQLRQMKDQAVERAERLEEEINTSDDKE